LINAANLLNYYLKYEISNNLRDSTIFKYEISNAMSALSETFRINNNINLYLLNAIPEAHLKDQSASKGRTVGEQFAHMHNVRLMWLKAAEPLLLEGLEKLEKENGITKSQLKKSLEDSDKAIEVLLEHSSGKIKGFKPHATAFLGYVIAHEAHHRGQILLSLKQSGHMVDKKVQFGIWEWGTHSA
jgi:uncharacterized damage-inducible protein DinB